MIVTPSANLSVEVKSATWVRYLTRAALASAGLLLLSNLPLVSTRLHAYLSAVPLAVAGVGYAMLQFRVRPARETLLKRLLLAATFMVWAVDQLLSSRWAAVFIGDVVIAAYVLDLHWLIREQTASVGSALNAFSVDERVHHRTLTEQVHRAVAEKRELDDGFAFRISSSRFPPPRIVEWIALEQRCCPFLAFKLQFDANHGPVWLHLSGGPGVKKIIGHELDLP
jgi:hypothetical protein